MRLQLTFGVLALIISAAALALEHEVDETISANPAGVVRIDVPRGNLDVTAWDRDEVRVAGRIDEEARDFIFRTQGDETLIEVRLDRRGNWDRGNSDLDVFVPAGSEVEFKGVSLDVTVLGITGGVKGGTVSGELSVSDVMRRVDVGTVSGDIILRRCAGRIHVNSVSGEIDVRDTSGEGSYESVSGSILVRGPEQLEIETETISGDIVVEVDRIREVRAESVSGEIELSGDVADGGRLELESVSGRIDLAVGKGTSARFEVETGSGGIRNELTNDKPRVAKYSRNSELRFTMGDGSGLVIVGTASGRVVLRGR